jgi:hypothetical protein
MPPGALQKKPICHDIVKGTVDQATVSHVGEADMVLTRAEAGSTNALIHMKLELQTDRVRRPADEAIIGIRSDTIICHGLPPGHSSRQVVPDHFRYAGIHGILLYPLTS